MVLLLAQRADRVLPLAAAAGHGRLAGLHPTGQLTTHSHAKSDAILGIERAMLLFRRKARLDLGGDSSRAAVGNRAAQVPADSRYDDAAHIADLVARGRHREIVGGAWDMIGQLQFDFLRDRGLAPNHRLLDIGCGALRGGIHFIRYLNAGNYWGVDRNESLIEAGWTAELGELRARQPREQLLCLTDFEFDRLGQTFDFAIAQSLFTHLSFNRIRLCLYRLAAVMSPSALFFATFFEAPDEVNRPARHDPGGRMTYPDRDPYHYRFADLSYAAGGAWEAQYIGDWGHPRGQKMLSFAVSGLPPRDPLT